VNSGVLKERVGPLPLWGWLAAITLAAVAYYLWNRHNAANAATTSTTTPAGQVPDFVIQNQYPPQPAQTPEGEDEPGKSQFGTTHGYTNVSPPTARADQKLGAQVMILNAQGNLVPWGGHVNGSLWISNAWLAQHGKPHTAPTAPGSAPSAKAPVKPAAPPATPPPGPKPKPASKAPSRAKARA